MRREIGPGDWPRALDDVSPGDELALAGGTYAGGVELRRGGTPGAPVIVRALEPTRAPAMLAAARHRVLLDVRADHVVIRGLHFGPTPSGTHGLVLRGASGVTVEECRFVGLGGLSIVETMTAEGITVRRNTIVDARTTAMYFGCHSGECAITNLLIEGNVIERVAAPWRVVGYGIQVKLNSQATIRANVILDTKGPAIMVYGSTRRDLRSVVEDNRVAGSRRSSGIVIGGGPATVRGNDVTAHRQAGISLQDYGRRRLLRDIEVRDNVLTDNVAGGISVVGRCGDVTIANNRITTRVGTPALPEPAPGLQLHANTVDCAPRRRRDR